MTITSRNQCMFVYFGFFPDHAMTDDDTNNYDHSKVSTPLSCHHPWCNWLWQQFDNMAVHCCKCIKHEGPWMAQMVKALSRSADCPLWLGFVPIKDSLRLWLRVPLGGGDCLSAPRGGKPARTCCRCKKLSCVPLVGP